MADTSKLIVGTESADSLTNAVSGVTIQALGGNDTVENTGNNDGQNFSLGSADDTNYTGHFVSIDGGEDDDLITNEEGNDVTITAGAGNDSIYNHHGYRPLIYGGEGDDSINVSRGHLTSVDGGAGNDTIIGTLRNDSLITNDWTFGGGALVLGGEGDDYIAPGYADQSSIDGGEGNDTLIVNGEYSTITGGDGDDSISNSGANVSIDAGAGSDSISNTGDNVSINGGDENDYIKNGGANVSISAGAGDDSIDNSSDDKSDNVIILGGDGNDSINNTGDNVSVNGGAGDDYIKSSGADTSIYGGAGDDSITLDSDATSNVIVYKLSDGNDVISGFNSTSTLQIGDGTTGYVSQKSGDDVLVTVGGGTITLSDAASLDSVNINGTLTDIETESLTGAATGITYAMLQRTAAGYPSLAGYLFHPEDYTDEEPTNYSTKDTWSITSSDGLKLEGYYYAPENAGDKWVILIHGYGHNHKHVYPYATSYLANGYNVLLVDQRAAGESEGEWLTMGAAESADIALWTQEIASRNSNAKITLHGFSMGAATAILAAARADTKNVTSLVEDCGYTNAMTLVNTLWTNYPFVSALLDEKALPYMDVAAKGLTGYSLSSAAPLDSISAAKMPTLFINGTNDSVVSTEVLDSLYAASGAEVKEKFIVEGAEHAMSAFVDPVGYSNTLFRFNAEANGEGWSNNNSVSSILLTGTKYADTFINSGSFVTIQALGGSDSVENVGDNDGHIYSLPAESIAASDHYGHFVSISGGDDADFITNEKGNNVTITADAGNDTIYSHHGYKPMIYGGAGNDSINIANGHMTSVDAGSGNDTIIGSIHDSLVSDNWTFGGHALILSGKGKDYINPGYTNNASIDGGSGNDSIITAAQSSTLNGGSGNDYIYSKLSEGLEVDSPENNNLIYGGDGNDSIINETNLTIIDGGAGNDSITNIGDNDGHIYQQPQASVVANNYGHYVSINGGADDDYISNVEGNDVTIEAGDGNDVIYNDHGYRPMIYGGAGNDSINISRGSLTSVEGGAGNDTIIGTLRNDSLITSDWTFGRMAEISGDEGDDYINPFYSNSSSIDGGAGNDTIINQGEGTTITGGDGNDLIENIINENLATVGSDYVSIDGGKGNDTITNETKYGTIIAGAGNDSVNNLGESVSVNTGTGNDYVYNNAENVTIATGTGKDTILIGESVTAVNIEDFSRKDTLKFNSSVTSIGMLSDSLIAVAGEQTVTIGGMFTDSINSTWSLDGSRASYFEDSLKGAYISRGNIKFNDTIQTGETPLIVLDGIGSTDMDVMYNTVNIYPDNFAGNKASIVSNDGNLTVALGGVFSNQTFVGTKGADTINIQGANLTVNANSGHDFITSGGGDSLSINGGKGNDTIGNWNGESLTITGGTGNDSIYNDGAINTIQSGSGNDIVINDGSKVSIVGGKGKDTITSDGDDTTIIGGTGNDQISIGSGTALIEYASGDGNDTIYGFKANDTLSIEGGEYSRETSGDDVIYTVGKGKITLVGAANQSMSIVNDRDDTLLTGTAYADSIVNSGANVTINALAGNDSISNAEGKNVSLNAGKGNDTIYNFHAYYPTLLGGTGNDSIGLARGDHIYANGGSGNDTITSILISDANDEWGTGGHATILGGKGKDFLNVGYSDYSSIDGGTGNDTLIATGKNSTLNGGAGKNLISIPSSNYDDNTYVVLEGKTTVQGFKTGFDDDSDTVYIAGEAPAVDFKSGGLTFYYDNDSSNALTFSDITTTSGLNLYYELYQVSDKYVFIADDEWYDVKDGGEADYYVGATAKMNHGIDFSGVSKSVNVTLNTDYDSTTAKFWVNNIHSIIGGAGRTTIIGSDKADTIIAGKGTTTIDAGAGKDRISLSSGKALVNYKADDGNDIIYGFSTKSTLNISGAPYSTQTSGSNVIVAVNNNKITLSGAASLSKLNISGVAEEDVLTVDNDTSSPVTLAAKIEVVDASKRTTPVQIVGNSKHNSISGGPSTDTIFGSNGNDTIYGNAGNDSLLGGVGNDVLNGNAGNDTLDGGSGKDSLYGGAGNDSLVGSSSNDFLSGEAGNDTLDGGASNDSLYGGTGNDSLNGGKGNDLLSGEAGNDSLYGGTGADSLYGDAGNDYLHGEAGNDKLYGGAGNNTLWGGKGNDSLYGDAGNDTFIYKPGEGTDKIFDYASSDLLKILNKDGSEGGSFKNSSFSGNDLTLTINGGGKVIFNSVSDGDTFNINNKTYTLSDKTLK